MSTIIWVMSETLPLSGSPLDAFKKEICKRIIGSSFATLSVYEQIFNCLKSKTNVLILGETGTGKELVARSIHDFSQSNSGAKTPFQAINCTALPDDLFEAELFGYAKGAFTGANDKKAGLLEVALNGTFLFDEIGDLSPKLQAKILRVIEEKSFKRLGENIDRPVECRLLFATNKNLNDEQVRRGIRFRDDLYFRIAEEIIQVKPLRERRVDILDLFEFYLNQFWPRQKPAPKGLGWIDCFILWSLPWKGNVRELCDYTRRFCNETPGDGLYPAYWDSILVENIIHNEAWDLFGVEGDPYLWHFFRIAFDELKKFNSAEAKKGNIELQRRYGFDFLKFLLEKAHQIEQLPTVKALLNTDGHQRKPMRVDMKGVRTTVDTMGQFVEYLRDESDPLLPVLAEYAVNLSLENEGSEKSKEVMDYVMSQVRKKLPYSPPSPSGSLIEQLQRHANLAPNPVQKQETGIASWARMPLPLKAVEDFYLLMAIKSFNPQKYKKKRSYSILAEKLGVDPARLNQVIQKYNL